MNTNKIIENKRGIGFGRMLVIIVLVLLGLSIWIMTVSIPKVGQSIGTDSSNSINDMNPKFYFQDSMRLSLSRSIKTLAESSFINKENAGCLLYESSIILNDNCKPEIDYINYIISQDTSNYIQEYLKKYLNQDIQVACSIEGSNLVCESQEIELTSSKPGPYFSYSLKRNFKLKNSIDITNYNLEEIQKVYGQAKTCASDPSSPCTITSLAWQIDTLEQQGDFSVFSLKTKADYPNDADSGPIIWSFSMKK